MKFERSTIFITGGVSGLGEAAARFFISKGSNVVLADINKSRGNSIISELGNKQAIFVKCDVTNEKSVQSAIDKGLNKFGSINGCINCAGRGYARRVLSKSGKVHPIKPFSDIIKLNLVGTFNVLRLCAKAMLLNNDKERGVIINVASIAGMDGQIGQSAYSASKFGVCGMTLPIARDLGKFGIRICTIAPGIFGTPPMVRARTFGKAAEQKIQRLVDQVQFPKRLGIPKEFGHLCAHIFENTFLNGEVIRLDGAMRMEPV
eukprot:80446_1